MLKNFSLKNPKKKKNINHPPPVAKPVPQSSLEQLNSLSTQDLIFHVSKYPQDASLVSEILTKRISHLQDQRIVYTF